MAEQEEEVHVFISSPLQVSASLYAGPHIINKAHSILHTPVQSRLQLEPHELELS